MSFAYRISCALWLFLFLTTAQAQDVRALMFADALAAREAAVAADASAYSPRNFSRAEEALGQANRDYDQNRNLERIRAGLREAVTLYKTAAGIAEQAKIALASLIKTRNDAVNADAGLHDPDNWRQAERRYQDAITEYERGDAREAERRAAEAEELYRTAELVAIKAGFLNEARRLLTEAERARAERYAPATFSRAQNLLAEADRELSENRYDSDRPRDLARQAQYEARHALYLAKRLRQAREEREEAEALILAGETPLRQIAAAADLSVGFDEGYEAATARIIAYIEDLQGRHRELEQDLFERVGQVEALRAQLNSLEARYGGIDEQRAVLERQLARQAEEREKFRRIESMFGPDQAQVLRDGNDIVLRLVGTSFPVGKATIEPAAFGLLTQVMNAIRVFPQAKIRIEGHTDSFGGDAINMQLSRERAAAVRAYILANTDIDESRLEATGHGETRPIANNETREGRARNRRIDVVIRP